MRSQSKRARWDAWPRSARFGSLDRTIIKAFFNISVVDRLAVPPSRAFGTLVFLLVIALVFGGGGSPDAFGEFVVQIAAVMVLAIWLVRKRGPDEAIDPAAYLLVGLVAVLPVVHLIPVPPEIWTRLPSRDALAAAFAVSAPQLPWHPLSIAPYDGLASLLSLLPVVAAFLLTAACKPRDRASVALVIGAMAIASAIVVSAQSSGAASFQMHQRADYRFPAGTFANRNSQADLLVIGMIATLFATARTTTLGLRVVGLAATGYLMFALLTTGSRAGILLAVVPLGYAVFVARDRLRSLTRRTLAAVTIATIVACGSLAVLLAGNSVAKTSLARFGGLKDGRSAVIWPDAVFAAEQFWPFGAGIGTFPIAFTMGEQLDTLGTRIANRAHNDYLELAVEAGAFGLAVLAVGLLLTARLAWRAWATARTFEERNLVAFSLAVILVLAVHSLVDYPMRAMTLAVVAAAAVALLTKRGTPRAEFDHAS